MNTQQAVAQRILQLCANQNLSIHALARLSAVPPSTLKNIISGVSQNPGIVTIKLLCDGLDITITDFFQSDLFLNLEQEIE